MPPRPVPGLSAQASDGHEISRHYRKRARSERASPPSMISREARYTFREGRPFTSIPTTVGHRIQSVVVVVPRLGDCAGPRRDPEQAAGRRRQHGGDRVRAPIEPADTMLAYAVFNVRFGLGLSGRVRDRQPAGTARCSLRFAKYYEPVVTPDGRRPVTQSLSAPPATTARSFSARDLGNRYSTITVGNGGLGGGDRRVLGDSTASGLAVRAASVHRRPMAHRERG